MASAQAHLVLAIRSWFSPVRWSVYDRLIALAAAVLAASVFFPWFAATARFRNAPVYSGHLMQPRGTENGVEAHVFLWAVVALAIAELAVLIARNAPGRYAVRIRGYHRLLAATSALSCAAVLTGFVWRPDTWPGVGRNLGAGIYLVIGWGYGAIAALAAALISLGLAISAMQDQPGR